MLESMLPRRMRERRWSDLRGWGNSRLIRTSFAWLVIVPVAARLLRHVAGTHTFEVGGASLTFDIHLPFSWALFFFMALAFSIAQACYALACPPLVKRFASFREYRQQHLGNNLLKRHVVLQADILDIVRTDRESQLKSERSLDSVDPAVRRYLSILDVKDPRLSPEGALIDREDVPGDAMTKAMLQGFKRWEDLGRDEAKMSDVFDELQAWLDSVNARARYTSCVFFIIGFCLFAVVLAQNVWFVIKTMG